MLSVDKLIVQRWVPEDADPLPNPGGVVYWAYAYSRNGIATSDLDLVSAFQMWGEHEL